MKHFSKMVPRDLYERIREYDINVDDILYSARTDRNLQGGYEEGVVILTRQELITATLSADKKIHVSNKRTNWSELEVQVLISGGILYEKVKSEQGQEKELEQILAVFTNSCMNDMKQLVKLFRKISEGKEISKADLEEKETEEICPKCGTRYPNRDRKICPKCMDKRSVFFRMMSYFVPHKLRIMIMMLCYIGTALLNLAWPYLNGKILYDKVLSRNEAFLAQFGLPPGQFLILLGGVVVTMLFTSLTMQLLGMIQGVLTAKIIPDVVKEIKSHVFRAMGKLSVSFYSKRQTGGLMTRVLDDAERVTDFYINGLPYFFINLLTILFTGVVMCMMHLGLAVASLALLPFLTLISMKMLPRLWNHYGRRHRAGRSMNGQVNDNITGARVVKAFGQEESELKRFSTYNNRVKQAELSLVSYDNRYNALYHIVENITTFIVWGFGSALVLKKTSIEVGVLITFVGYVTQLKQPLDFMSRVFRWWAESINSAQRIFEIVDSLPEVRESANPIHLDYIKGDITLKNVTFGYEPHKPVLKNVSFEVEAGKMLGIVGRSGAGKSTLVNLISRLYDVEEGEILIDGVNVKDLSFASLHRSIAMVSQETYIFMGTVAQNIAYARPEATSEEIVRAAILASAHDFICKMPDGYDTMIGSSGRELSGGERQRLSIARAILANPRILILDEATASVDTETEKAIQNSLSFLVQGRTTLSIAHRLSTLRDADRLVVIEEGKLTEEGDHEKLIALEGTYYKLMQLQTKALALRAIE